MDYLKKVDWKNVLERLLWTFAEGFLLSIPIIAPENFNDLLNGSWKMLLAGAVGAGISAVKTVAVDIIKQHNEQYKKKMFEDEIEPDEYGDLEKYFDKKDGEDKEEK